jgi:hypothetical protein
MARKVPGPREQGLSDAEEIKRRRANGGGEGVRQCA